MFCLDQNIKKKIQKFKFKKKKTEQTMGWLDAGGLNVFGKKRC